MIRIASRMLSSPSDQATRPSAPIARREGDAAVRGRRPASTHSAFSAIGKQIRKNGIHQKTMFRRLTKIISTISAQIVMIGIENEQIRPRSRLSPAAMLAVERLLAGP